ADPSVAAGDGHGHAADASGRALLVAFGLNAAFLVVEVVGGLAFGSLALLADAAHMLTDVAALGLAIGAQRMALRPATNRHTYGFRRMEVLAAQANAAVLLLVSVWIVYESIARLRSPGTVDGGGMLVVAILGLIVNLVSAAVLVRAHDRTLNVRGAVLHLLSDAAGSSAAIVAAVLILAFGWERADPIASLAVTALIVVGAFTLLRQTYHVLLEGTPKGINPADIERALASEADVTAVHHLHVWNLASDEVALSAHVVLEGEPSLHWAQERGDRLKTLLAVEFGIQHATLELECHPCEPAPLDGTPLPAVRPHDR
ncbi:MAG: cation transporter, partial [Actinomycetia bacterium]|nr:cation transporter [Actinomycetes bacterium]